MKVILRKPSSIDDFILRAGSEEQFLEMAGTSMRQIKIDYWKDIHDMMVVEKYQFSKNDDMSYCLSTNNLNLRGTRKKIVTPNDKTGWARRSNLSDSKISEMYNHIITESDYFKEELDYLLHYNIARAVILSKLLKNKMDMDEILKYDEILNEKSEFPFLSLRILDGLVLNDKKIKNIIQDRFEDIQTELEQKTIFLFQNNNTKHLPLPCRLR